MQPHGHDEFYGVISSLGLDKATSTLPIGQWPSVLLGSATAWWRYTHALMGQVHIIGPTPSLSNRPNVCLRSRALVCDLDFGVAGTETIAALGVLLDTDTERRRAFDRGSSDIPVAIEFGTEDPCQDPTVEEPRRSAIMRVFLPQWIPAQFWPNKFDVPDREHATSIGYRKMQEVIENTWRHWVA